MSTVRERAGIGIKPLLIIEKAQNVLNKRLISVITIFLEHTSFRDNVGYLGDPTEQPLRSGNVISYVDPAP